ncbi:sugar phosphate isomerase/epimerase [Myxococcota bacterium]|nr:sugar phosphate isomerase/epimerase [Myxococcota bacterium]
MPPFDLGPRDLVLSSGMLENPPLEILLEAAQRGDYAGITLWPGHYHPSRSRGPSIPEMRRMLDDSGLVLQDLDALVSWVGPNDPGGPYHEEATEAEIFEFAEGMGARGVNLLQLGTPGVSEQACADALANVCERAACVGLLTYLEFSRSRPTPDLPSAARVVAASGHERARLTVDTWHVQHGPGSFADLEPLAADRIGSIQLSDAPAQPPADLAHASRHARLVPGEGVIDYSHLLHRLDDLGSLSPLTLEVFDASRVERLGPTGFAQLAADAVRTLLPAAGPEGADRSAPNPDSR